MYRRAVKQVLLDINLNQKLLLLAAYLMARVSQRQDGVITGSKLPHRKRRRKLTSKAVLQVT